MLPYFPLDQNGYKMKLGVQALNPDHLIEVEPTHYLTELALKQTVLASDYPYYFQALPGTEHHQWETLELVLTSMARRYPQYFLLTIKGQFWTWCNWLLQTETSFTPVDSSSLPLPPLDWLGRQVQEDLLVMQDDGDGKIPLVAGHLCFPNDWCIGDKIAKSFMDIHYEVPRFATSIGASSQAMMERLKTGRPVVRVNWSIKSTNQLNLATRFSAEIAETKKAITSLNAGERCYFRIERQTLSRLPRTRGILFTVRTYQEQLGSVIQKPEYRNSLITLLKTAPPEILDYKGITPFFTPLLTYLEGSPSL